MEIVFETSDLYSLWMQLIAQEDLAGLIGLIVHLIMSTLL
jgi:hypothetical protein